MNKITALIFFVIIGCASIAQTNYQREFKKAYELYPSIPKGVLEAIGYTNTHLRNIKPENEPPSCLGLPYYYGVMGLVEDGKGYFRNNLQTVSSISGYSMELIKNDAETNILAYADAFNQFLNATKLVEPSQYKAKLVPAILALSELPYQKETLENDFALNAHLYAVLTFLNDPNYQTKYNFPSYNIDLEDIFGKDNLAVLSSSFVKMDGNQIKSQDGYIYGPSSLNLMGGPCFEFPGVIWDEADPSNYSSRSGTAITHVTVHTMQGTYAGAISWFKNPAANVSAHYNMRASDGQITQMVCEIDKAWHVSNSNPYAIGIEHEGYISDASWYTNVVYETSAALVKDICADNAINQLRTYSGPGHVGLNPLSDGCYKVKGHQHFPSQTHVDPGQYWDWDYYYELINAPFATTTYTTCAGSFQDPGGAGNYANDERGYYLIQPTGASSVTLSFTSFNLETGYDYLYVYDGTSDDDSLIATLNGTSLPSSITANSGSMYLKFYSDCGTTASGWDANWTCSTAFPLCDNPSNLNESSLTALNTTLNWNAVSGANGYEIKVKLNNSAASWNTYYTANNSFDLSGLMKSALYIWKVRTLCSADSSPFVADSFITPELTSSYYTTACSGNFNDAGGLLGQYTNNEDYTYTIEPTGANAVTVVFDTFNIENAYDFLYIYDGNSTAAPLLGTYTSTNSPGTVVSSGGAITFRFTSDVATTSLGWQATWSCDGGGAPITSIDSLNYWQTTDFDVSFTDVDSSGSGLQYEFYQVLELTGTEYTGNTNAGFLSDDFNSLSNWTNNSGTWVLGSARQTDETNGNSNLYTSLTQGNDVYLYHWKMKISGSGTNRRAGIHFYCDNPSLTNRGNSYFVYYRVDQNKVQIYDVVADSWTLDTDDNSVIDPDVWYDCKVIYNSLTGEIKVYQDNVLVSSWTDASPLTSANSISLRTGNADVSYRNFRVYKGRSVIETVPIGTASTDHITVQNPDPLTPAGKINSLVVDNDNSWSLKDSVYVNIDWSAPENIAIVHDGDSLQYDFDTLYDNTVISGSWTASEDTNSDVVLYYYYVGTTPGGNDVATITATADTAFTLTGLNLNFGDTVYITVLAENGAGLTSIISISDGAIILPTILEFISPFDVYVNCKGSYVTVELTSNNQEIDKAILETSSGNDVTSFVGYFNQNNDLYWSHHLYNWNDQNDYLVKISSNEKVYVEHIGRIDCQQPIKLQVYPSKFDQVVNFNLIGGHEHESFQILIYDALGRLIVERNAQVKSVIINTLGLSKGMYYYKVLTSSNEFEGKIIK